MSVPDNRSLTRDGFNIVVKYLEDDNPDLSYLGEFCNHPNQSNDGRKKFQYPAYDRATEKIVHNFDDVQQVLDDHPHWNPRDDRFIVVGTGDPEYLAQDAQRLEKYGVDWYCVGIVAEAWRKGVLIAKSTGVWGIESDSDAAHFHELAEEQIVEVLDAAQEKLKELCEDAQDI